MELDQTSFDHLDPGGAKLGGIEVRLVVSVSDNLSMDVLVTFGVMARPHIHAAAMTIRIGWIREATGPVHVCECLDRTSARLGISIIQESSSGACGIC